MARKIFKRTGLRRDKNFGDLLDPVLSLNNLLGAVVTGEGLTFINEDLNCIRNIFSEKELAQRDINNLLEVLLKGQP